MVGAAVAPTPERRKRGPRSQMAFGSAGGTMVGLQVVSPERKEMRSRAPGHNQRRAA